MAIGFLPGQLSGERYIVRASDAHAWPELYFQGYGWLRFEPTPGARAGSPPPYAVLGAGSGPTGGGREVSETNTASGTASATSSTTTATAAPVQKEETFLDSVGHVFTVRNVVLAPRAGARPARGVRDADHGLAAPAASPTRRGDPAGPHRGRVGRPHLALRRPGAQCARGRRPCASCANATSPTGTSTRRTPPPCDGSRPRSRSPATTGRSARHRRRPSGCTTTSGRSAVRSAAPGPGRPGHGPSSGPRPPSRSGARCPDRLLPRRR